MKKVIMMVMVAFTLVTLSQSCKKKMKDEDIQKAATEALVAAKMTGTTVKVEKGVATLTGSCVDDKCKTECEAIVKKISGVTEVKNECTIAAAPTSLAVTKEDPKMRDAVKAILKDIPGVTLKGFSDKGVMLEGSISAAVNMKLKQALGAAKIMMDAVGSKLTVK